MRSSKPWLAPLAKEVALLKQACIKKTKVKIKPFFQGKKSVQVASSQLVVLNRQLSATRELVRGSLTLGQG